MGLYERLVQEAAELPEDPNWERNKRMSAYLRNLRRAAPQGGGGYVTTEELRQERQRYLKEVGSLCALLKNSPGGIGGKYWLGYLKRRYPTEYAHLRAIRDWHR